MRNLFKKKLLTKFSTKIYGGYMQMSKCRPREEAALKTI